MRTRIVASLVIGLVEAATGCHPPPPLPPLAPRSAVRPLPFAGLFEPGKRWKFSITEATQSEIESDPDQEPADTGELLCQNEDVHTLAGARIATISCEASGAISLRYGDPAGVYVATARGLWRLNDAPLTAQAIAELKPTEVWIPFPPVAATTSETNDEPIHATTTENTLVPFNRGWCVVTNSVSDVDEDGSVLCVGATGLIGGSGYSEHVVRHQQQWGKVP